jgi:oligopeptidase B
LPRDGGSVADGATGHRIAVPDEVYALSPGANPEVGATSYRFVVSSLIRPATWIDYHPAERRLETVKVEEVVGGHDPELYETKRLYAMAPDGVRVPLSIAHRRDVGPGEGAPCLLYGYGAYGINIDPGFSSHRLSLLERGFVYAIAHVRGGAELGEAWHEAGRMETKEHTFDDFNSAAERHEEAGWAGRDRLAIRGGSAGGLLIGAVVNRRPELFAAAIAQVPFVDVLNTMLDPTLPLTVTEYEEWGDPSEREAFERIRRYAPYENVVAQDYPEMLVTAGWSDPRVQYWEAAKWVARLRAIGTGSRMLLLKSYLDAGHFGGSGRYREIEEEAFVLAFLLDRLAVEI